MSIKATAAPGAIIALPRNKAHVVKEISPAGNYGAVCGKVVPPAALEQADDSNLCGNCKRLSAAVEPEETTEETPAAPEHTEPVAPRPEPVNASMPILADKLVLPDPEELARATDPDNNDPRARLGVLELGKERAQQSRRTRKVSGRQPKDHKPLSDRQPLVTPIGIHLNDPGNLAGGPGGSSTDPVVARADGVAMLPKGESGHAGYTTDPKIKYMDIVGGRYGYLTRTELAAQLKGLDRPQRETFRRAYRRTVKANKASGHVPLMGSRRIVSIESVRGAK